MRIWPGGQWAFQWQPGGGAAGGNQARPSSHAPKAGTKRKGSERLPGRVGLTNASAIGREPMSSAVSVRRVRTALLAVFAIQGFHVIEHMTQLFQGVSLKALQPGEVKEAGGATYRQTIAINQGIADE